MTPIVRSCLIVTPPFDTWLWAYIAYNLILHKLHRRFGHIQVYNFESLRDHEQFKFQMDLFALYWRGPSWLWSYGCWIYNYLCKWCISPLMLWVWIPLKLGVLDTTWCDKVCQCLGAGWLYSPGTRVSSTSKIDRHDIAEILLKVVLNNRTITLINLTKTLCLTLSITNDSSQI